MHKIVIRGTPDAADVDTISLPVKKRMIDSLSGRILKKYIFRIYLCLQLSEKGYTFVVQYFEWKTESRSFSLFLSEKEFSLLLVSNDFRDIEIRGGLF